MNTSIIKNVGGFVAKNSPTILTGLSVAGVISTAALTAEATPKALRLIEEATIPFDTPLTKLEVVKLTWKCYIPPITMGIITIGCIIWGNSINLKRNAALAGAYSLAQTSFKEYQHKVVDILGEKKAQEVKDSIALDRINKNPISDTNPVIITGKGDVLCYDVVSGRYFKNDIEQIRRIQNDLNRSMLSDMYVPLNDVYYALGLDGTRNGDEVGWNVDNGFIEFQFSSQLTPDGTPCLVIDYQLAPKYGYQKRL